ncbi:MAG TPA: biotin--[acetyl-CoA-carboxylase] ligase [Bryobacteraceae bacterium]|nr:biotin--[acetyl-CoA-carboxylase] ligase [Bryobacteraceae bacterium]
MSLDLAWLRSELPGRQMEWHSILDSTMTEASRLAARGCASGTIVGAEEQTAGKGRLGRSWHSEPGSGLYVSIVLRYEFQPDARPVVTLALGLAARDAIQKATGIACDLRWPNDVLIRSKKCAGILTELEGSAIIAGIGINVNHTTFPEELSATATSLRLEGGQTYAREKLLVELARSVDSFCRVLEHEGREPILRMFSSASSYVYGRRVEVDSGDSIVSGTTAGLNDAGFLILRQDDGRENVILAGGVRPCS